MKTLGERMIDYRADHDLSQIKFAQLCRLSIQTVCNIESGKQKPTNLTKHKILKIIGEQQ